MPFPPFLSMKSTLVKSFNYAGNCRNKRSSRIILFLSFFHDFMVRAFL